MLTFYVFYHQDMAIFRKLTIILLFFDQSRAQGVTTQSNVCPSVQQKFV